MDKSRDRLSLTAKRPTKVRRVSLIGGGTGSFNLLSGLRSHAQLRLDSIVTMMDSGGDSGRLRDEHGILPPGDVRRCLVALSEQSPLLRELFNLRFDEPPLQGRSFGNLFFLAVTRLLGDEQQAIEAMGRLLGIAGRVIPVTLSDSHLVAELEDGSLVHGEGNIDVRQHNLEIPIRRVFLEPAAEVNPVARESIMNADFVVLAPGNLYTSTVPNLLVRGVPEALQKTAAPLIHVINLMTVKGETDGYSAARHLDAVVEYAGRVPDAVMVHSGKIPPRLLSRYSTEGALPVEVDEKALKARGVRLVHRANLRARSSLVRHDPGRTAEALLALFRELSAKAGSGPRAVGMRRR